MPISKSAKQSVRNADRKRVFNLRRKREVNEVLKQIEKFVAEKKYTEAQELLPKAYKALDKAAKMGTLKENTVSRKKSRLSASIKKVK